MLWPLAILIPVTIILFVCLLDTVYITIQIYPCDIINENGEMVHIKRQAVVVHVFRMDEYKIDGVPLNNIIMKNVNNFDNRGGVK
jgi:hypothetical protein